MEIVNQIVMKKISEVKPYVRNPRKNDKTVNLLVEIIPKVGFNVPLVIDRNGIIVKGHARYAAAIRLGGSTLRRNRRRRRNDQARPSGRQPHF